MRHLCLSEKMHNAEANCSLIKHAGQRLGLLIRLHKKQVEFLLYFVYILYVYILKNIF